jgi:hypothetical protein
MNKILTKLKQQQFGPIINIISYIFLFIIINLFLWDLRIFDIFQIFIFSIISFALSMYISDNFKISNNLFIKILQKLVFINSIVALFGFIFYLFDVSVFSTLFCEGDSDNEFSNSGNTSHSGDGESENNNKKEEVSLKDIARITSNRDNTASQ